MNGPAPEGEEHGRERAVPASTGAGHVEVLDDRPPPNVVVDTDGQLHAESGIVTYAGEGLGRGTMALAVLKHPAYLTAPESVQRKGPPLPVFHVGRAS